MPLVTLGINHITSPVALRERLAIGEHELEHALGSLCALTPVTEGAILSTCNRTEVYAAVAAGAGDAEEMLAEWLAGRHGLHRQEFEGHLYSYRDAEAAAHLMGVAAGINSMILGEPDIQRQVRQALEAAQGARSIGPLLQRLFQEALTVGKRVRTETGLARGSFSVGAAAVELATQIFGESLQGHTVLVLGAGKMSEVTARHLQARGAPTIMVANRTYAKAAHLAAQFGGEARRFDELAHALLSADIVVCSTSAPHFLVTRTLVKEAMRARRNRPLFLIDIAVPRDVEPSVDGLDSVYLYNLDHLQTFVAEARHAREAEISRAREIVQAGADEYSRWRGGLEAAPLVVAVREKLDAVRLAELARLRARLPGLSDKEWRLIEQAMQSVVNKIAHPAIVTLKDAAGLETAPAELETIRRAFGLAETHAETPVPPLARRLEDTRKAGSG